MPIQEKKYKEYLSQEYEPVDESAMPYLVDIRAIKAYADSKGVAIASLSDEEKQQFMIPNPNYRKKRRHGIAAVFWIHLTSYIEVLFHQPSYILPMNVEADFIKEALDVGLYKQGVTMYLQLHNAKFNKE